VSLSPEKPAVVLPSLPSLTMVVYQPPVASAVSAPESSALVSPKATLNTGKSEYSISVLGNFIPFATLSNDEIVRLIEDYVVVFHTTEHKKAQIIQDIKNIKKRIFLLFWRGCFTSYKNIMWFKGILLRGSGCGLLMKIFVGI
jgi:hypothetical protein